MKTPTRTFCVILFLSFIASSNAHEPKDGEIARSIQVVVRDDIAHIRIAVGLNDQTLSKLLATIKQKSKIRIR